MTQQPIAIIGQACLLPGALDVKTFADNVFARVDAVHVAPEGRFGVPTNDVLGEGPGRSYSLAGGYVEGFEALWDPTGFENTAGLDPLVLWLLHTGRAALHDAGLETKSPRLRRAGAIFGNLSFASEGMSRWGEAFVLSANGLAPGAAPDPRNCFMSGLPADLLASGLGLGGPCFALDAACASSLYAIKLACDALQAGRADLMLAGAVQRADNLFLHIGFCALGAMSRVGRSRPFHRDADGLVPAEGAAFLLLKRLDDAVRDGDRILGVVRGVGLSNDARARNLLAPSREGQVRALRAAYEAAGLSPKDVQFVECHATGTPVGDRTELTTMAEVFAGHHASIGSLKSMLGHLITVAGVAGLLKVLAGFERQMLPPSLHTEAPSDALAETPFQLVTTPSPWNARVRRAAVSAFGFGGNNAHLLVEQYDPALRVPISPPKKARIGVMAMSALVGDCDDFGRAVFRGEGQPRRKTVSLGLEGLRFPPNDLRLSLAQQTLMMRAAMDATAGRDLPRTRTGVIVGMGADVAVTGYGLRWRLGALTGATGERLAALRDSVIPELRAENVVGTMPNIPANRLNIQLDIGGPSFSVSAEELSGIRALEIAIDALSRGELDVVLVGAVEMGCDPLHAAALEALAPGRMPADAAVCLVLGRLDDDALAEITICHENENEDGERLAGSNTSAHAASGLVDVARAILCVRHGLLPGGAVWPGRRALVEVKSLGGQRQRVLVCGVGQPAPLVSPKPARGPMLELPAHAPPIVFSRSEMNMQIMAPAPSLPLTSSVVPEVLSDLANKPLRPPMKLRAERSAPPANAALSMLLAQRATVASVHRSFLAQQAAVHQAFLDARANTTLMFVGATTSSPLREPLPAPLVARGLPAPAASVVVTDHAEEFPGPKLSREDLILMASGPISHFFGPSFAPQDAYARVVRMPKPPLLLADRVLGISGPPGVLGKGSIWTETDVTSDAWYLHENHMPAGILIESGQADLLLASYQGIDVNHNRGERAYRLLGCVLRFHGGLPVVGDTLRYDIHIDGHARLGEIRMFFFHYDCRIGGEVRLSVREGQAGFFSDAELAGSGGVLWSADEAEVDLSRPLAAPVVPCQKSSFDQAALIAFSEGRIVDCFGPGFERADTHTLTPRIAGKRQLLLQRVSAFDATGGPWRRGYLRADWDVTPNDWFFEGHFHNDPCMPGTLMLEGCLQALQFYLTALGFTLHRDGWRFEPGCAEDFKLRCRGQVIPTSKQLTYELFIQEIGGGPKPYVKAQVLCTVDGLKCFHADPLVLEMVPDWPMTRMDIDFGVEKPCVSDYRALLACAWGRPSDAFGPMYKVFDSPRRCPRLPGPPYHFMSRVLHTTGEMGVCKAGATVEVEYDVPPDAWYFAENSDDTMPFAVLMEAALQPCGWLASWIGSTLTTDQDLLFRNLDGKGRVFAEVRPDAGTLTTRVKCTQVHRLAGMIIESFQVEMWIGAQKLYEMETVFGFFPPEAFENQVGIGSEESDREWLAAPSDFLVHLRDEPSRYFAGPLRMPRSSLLMPDRITGFSPGPKGLGKWRADKDIRATEWCFKAHFYGDPVQPGSLGVESMLEVLKFAMIHEGVGAHLKHPRFEPIALGTAITWKYRGQVIPENRLVQTEVEILDKGTDTWLCDAHLWVDGKRIYTAHNLGMRVVEGEEPAPPPKPRTPSTVRRTVTVPVPVDHCPTYVLPALPMMTMAMLALQGTGGQALSDATATRWLTFPDGPRTVDIDVTGNLVVLSSGGVPFFSGRAAEPVIPAPPVPLLSPVPGPSGEELYASGELFHGPAFHVVERVLARGDNGTTLLLHAGGSFGPDVLLDGATHGVVHAELAPGKVAYPYRLKAFSLFGAPPKGLVRCEVRQPDPARTEFTAHFYHGENLVAYFLLQEVLLPKGPIGEAPAALRRDFLLGRFAPGVSLSRLEGGQAFLTETEVKASDWLPGTIVRVYGTENASEIARKELAAARLHVHPRVIATPDVNGWWRRRLGKGAWPGEALIEALGARFLDAVLVFDPSTVALLSGRRCLFLANHQNYLESVLFTCIASALFDMPIRALAKVEHQKAWLGELYTLMTRYPGHELGELIVWFDQQAPADLPGLVRSETSSLLVHVEGTRQTTPGQPVEKLSSLWVDLALERNLPIVPVAFRGGLGGGHKHDVPVRPQTHHIGRPILPAELAALPYAERRKLVAEAINTLGVPEKAGSEAPMDPREALREALAGFFDFFDRDADAGWMEGMRRLVGEERG